MRPVFGLAFVVLALQNTSSTPALMVRRLKVVRERQHSAGHL
jgi:hypothetical protein